MPFLQLEVCFWSCACFGDLAEIAFALPKIIFSKYPFQLPKKVAPILKHISSGFTFEAKIFASLSSIWFLFKIVFNFLPGFPQSIKWNQCAKKVFQIKVFLKLNPHASSVSTISGFNSKNYFFFHVIILGCAVVMRALP